MDPLSVIASVVGMLAAAGQVISTLSKVKSSIKYVPRSMDHAISEVKAVEISLSAVHKFLLGLSSALRRRISMIQVDHLLATLTEAVLTFSELEALVKPIATGPESSMMDRVKWSWKEDLVTDITLRLERHKSSLSLMLNITQCESDLEAEKSRNTLQNLVIQLLESKQDVSRRLRNLEEPRRPESILTSCYRNDNSLDVVDDPVECTGVISGELNNPAESNTSLNGPHVAAFHSSFEIDLNTSRVYRRTQPYECDTSFTSSNVRTHAWSIFSGLSLSEISAVSALALPLYAHDISNNDWYSFGEIDLDFRIGGIRHSSPNPVVSIVNATSSSLSPIFEESHLSMASTIRHLPLAEIIDRITLKIPEYKLMVLGDKDVAKFRLTNQFSLAHCVQKNDFTIIDCCRNFAVVDGQACMLELFDNSGVEEFTVLQDLWIRESNGFVIVYSIANRDSFIRTRRFHRQIQATQSEFFYGEVDPAGISIMLVGIDCDPKLQRQVSTQEGGDLARELGCGFVEASVSNGFNVEKAFYDVVRMIRGRKQEVAKTGA